MISHVGELETAEDVWREAIQAVPSKSSLYYSLGSLLGKMDHYEVSCWQSGEH